MTNDRRSACADREYSGTTGLVPVDRRLEARSVSLITLSPPRGLSPWSDDCWLGCQSWLHGDKPRGGRPMLGIDFWLSVIDPPGQARRSPYCETAHGQLVFAAVAVIAAAMSAAAVIAAAVETAAVGGRGGAGRHGVRGAAVGRRGVMHHRRLHAARGARAEVGGLAEGSRVVLCVAAVIDGQARIARLPGGVRPSRPLPGDVCSSQPLT